MAIEINRAASPWIYRINPTSPKLIDRRENKHGARWQPYNRYLTAHEARTELLKLEKPTKDANA